MATFWTAHHAVMRGAAHADTVLFWLNMVFLALLSLIPFPTPRVTTATDHSVRVCTERWSVWRRCSCTSSPCAFAVRRVSGWAPFRCPPGVRVSRLRRHRPTFTDCRDVLLGRRCAAVRCGGPPRPPAGQVNPRAAPARRSRTAAAASAVRGHFERRATGRAELRHTFDSHESCSST
ncbi:TMEM175 family protein [Streptomyces sp. NBC_00557]|uniref:TMEM175 family protein n=1 Tax=Streptomyces sp. NBC_00557 TaxID=2975776 RepID=UPI003FCD9B39